MLVTSDSDRLRLIFSDLTTPPKTPSRGAKIGVVVVAVVVVVGVSIVVAANSTCRPLLLLLNVVVRLRSVESEASSLSPGCE
jgi:hypothetical protein